MESWFLWDLYFSIPSCNLLFYNVHEFRVWVVKSIINFFYLGSADRAGKILFNFINAPPR